MLTPKKKENIGRHLITCKSERNNKRCSTRIRNTWFAKMLKQQSAKIKELQEETAKDCSLVRIAGYVTERMG